jgi:hypothetical protein
MGSGVKRVVKAEKGREGRREGGREREREGERERENEHGEGKLKVGKIWKDDMEM